MTSRRDDPVKLSIPTIAEVESRREAAAIVTPLMTRSHADLASEAIVWHRAMTRAGIGPGDAVGLLTEDLASLSAMVLACLEMGAVFVLLDADHPPRRLVRLVTTARVRAVLVCDELLGASGGIWSGLADLLVTPSRRSLRVAGPSNLPEGVACIFFTSGSTGEPHAVLGRRSAIQHLLQWEIDEFNITSEDRFSRFVRPMFDASLRDILVPMAVGAQSHVPPWSPYAVEARQAIRWLVDEAITVAHATPTLLRRLTSTNVPLEFPALRKLLLSGEPLFGADVVAWAERGGLPEQLTNLYGTTEATMIKVFHQVDRADEQRVRVPAGQPITGAQVYVVDSDLRPVAAGMVGEIVLRTADLTAGYLDDPGATSRIFVPNPFSGDPSDLLHRTGDRGRELDNGELDVLGRMDDQLNLWGCRIEPGEIEQVIRSLPGVRDTVVGTTPSAPDQLVAWVAASEPGVEGVMRAALSEVLPSEMVPARVVFVEELPVGPTGKVVRRDLPLPSEPIDEADDAHHHDLNDIEIAVMSAFCDVLERDTCPLDRDFFSLGGTSLKATRLLACIARELRVKLPMRLFFENATVASIAAHVRHQPDSTQRSQGGTWRPPACMSAFQRSVWVVEQMMPGAPLCMTTACLTARGPLDARRLRLALQEVVRGHDVLRTRFEVVEGEPHPQTSDDVSVDWVQVSLDPDRADNELFDRLAAASQARPFDLATGPLVRCHLAERAADDHLIVLTIHHVVSDELTLRWAVEEWLEHLARLGAGDAPMAGHDSHFATYAARDDGRSPGALTQGLEYWKGIGKTLQPLGFAENYGEGDSTEDACVFDAPSQVRTGLAKICASLHVTPFIVLSSVVQVAIYRLTGRNKIVVTTDIDRREDHFDERPFGPFVNTILHSVAINPADRFRDVLERGRATWLDGEPFRYVPYDRVVNAVEPSRRGACAWLTEVTVNVYEGETVVTPIGDLCIKLVTTRGKASAPLEVGFELGTSCLTVTTRRRPEIVNIEHMQGLAAEVEALLVSVVTDVEARVGTTLA